MADFQSVKSPNGGVTVIRKSAAGGNASNTTSKIGPVMQAAAAKSSATPLPPNSQKGNPDTHPATSSGTFTAKPMPTPIQGK